MTGSAGASTVKHPKVLQYDKLSQQSITAAMQSLQVPVSLVSRSCCSKLYIYLDWAIRHS